jgi:hypothetical protein
MIIDSFSIHSNTTINLLDVYAIQIYNYGGDVLINNGYRLQSGSVLPIYFSDSDLGQGQISFSFENFEGNNLAILITRKGKY